MITILFHVTVHPGREKAFREIASRLTQATHAKDEGCKTYVFHQQKDNPREFVLYEQWQDMAALNAHLAHTRELLGAPAQPSGLPAAMAELCENSRAVFYDVVR